jgi:ubiquinol-cytochrome c reductase cytochrome c1 subunit
MNTLFNTIIKAKTTLFSIIAVIGVILPFNLAIASGGAALLDKAPDLSNDQAALQHGAKLFVNYCLNCHNASSMRYNRLIQDLGLSEEQIKNNLLFTGDKVGDMMKVAMSAKDAKDWFGAVPPDLSVIARAKASPQGSGADYIYTYLRSYYRDNSRPTGFNNVVYPSVAMPHVLWDRQPARALQKTDIVHNLKEHSFEKVVTHYDEKTGIPTITKTAMPDYSGHEQATYQFITPEKDIAAQQQFDRDVAALTAFMDYMADPSAKDRQSLGVWVLFFLGVLILLTYLLNREYWKDIK